MRAARAVLESAQAARAACIVVEAVWSRKAYAIRPYATMIIAIRA
jgi:hypothetical protein